MSKLEKGSHYLEDGSIVVGFIISIFLATVSRAFLHPLVSLLISLVCGAILILAIIKLERAGFWRFLGMAFVAVLFAVNAVSCFLEMGMRGEDARPESEVFAESSRSTSMRWCSPTRPTGQKESGCAC